MSVLLIPVPWIWFFSSCSLSSLHSNFTSALLSYKRLWDGLSLEPFHGKCFTIGQPKSWNFLEKGFPCITH
ncbi:MAG: hypothetical protein EB120_07735 [Proteobacteria bacterium]|nr:hypothetical protein [Pseudomonadota bacterium]